MIINDALLTRSRNSSNVALSLPFSYNTSPQITNANSKSSQMTFAISPNLSCRLETNSQMLLLPKTNNDSPSEAAPWDLEFSLKRGGGAFATKGRQ